MGYTYEEYRKTVFTESGVKALLEIRDNANRLLEDAGALTLWNIIKGVCGDSWMHLACVDYLVETNQLREIPNPKRGAAQDRVFTKPSQFVKKGEGMKECNEFCEGHLICPETEMEECTKVMNYKVYSDGSQIPCTVYCFGCGKTHDIEVDYSELSQNHEL